MMYGKWENHLSKMARERLSGSLLGDLFTIEHEYKPICLSSGQPTQDLFPMDQLRPFFEHICDERELFGYYPFHAGYVALREWINDWMHDDGISASWVTKENIMLTTGSQQGLSLVSELLIDEGTLVALEAPTYIEALRTFRKSGAKFVEVLMDDDGIVPESFEEVCEKCHPNMLYTIPNFQNPSGSVALVERRKAILAIAIKYDVVILEDDPYRYISFMEHTPASYLSLSGDDDRVIYLGSFSKIICPGIRCGWMVIPPAILKTMTQLRHTIEISLPAWSQCIISGFCHQIDRKAYFSKLQGIYKARCSSLVTCLQKYMVPKGLTMNSPQGGYFIWASIPGIDDMYKFCNYAIKKHGVSVVPGCIFFLDPSQGRNSLRFSFANITPEMATSACIRLAYAYDEYLA